ncbi:MAG: hypothetical protein A2X86_12720 [Bdellovibrionales bacterium GWA2_49_15]|nr:MAG: hypothetical protein A2X86_12720 [Bdellovibrionales bacterium GWA2_49_15]
MKTSINDDSKGQLFEKVAAIAATFGSPARLKILYILAQAPRSVDSVAQMTGESIANTSQHLQKLLHEGIVCVSKQKLSRVYRLSNEVIALLIEDLFDLTEKLSPGVGAEIDKTVTLASIADDLQSKRAFLLDVREEIETGHSPVEGAIALPIQILKEKAKTLHKNKTYYIVCRGRACELATEGVRILRSLGFKAFRLKESPSALRQKSKLTLA